MASRKAQGALEYLILIGGAVTVGVIVLTLLLGASSSSSSQSSTGVASYQEKILTKGKPNVMQNGLFESPGGWGSEVTNCASASCRYRTNQSPASISGYSWYGKTINGAIWYPIMTQRTTALDYPSTAFDLSFDYYCITATAVNGWFLLFRDGAQPCCADALFSNVTAALSDGTSTSKVPTNFVCAEGEKGKVTAKVTTLSNAAPQYSFYWYNRTGSAQQEIAIDNFIVTRA